MQREVYCYQELPRTSTSSAMRVGKDRVTDRNRVTPSQELTTKFASTARSASVAILPAWRPCPADPGESGRPGRWTRWQLCRVSTSCGVPVIRHAGIPRPGGSGTDGTPAVVGAVHQGCRPAVPRCRPGDGVVRSRSTAGPAFRVTAAAGATISQLGCGLGPRCGRAGRRICHDAADAAAAAAQRASVLITGPPGLYYLPAFCVWGSSQLSRTGW